MINYAQQVYLKDFLTTSFAHIGRPVFLSFDISTYLNFEILSVLSVRENRVIHIHNNARVLRCFCKKFKGINVRFVCRHFDSLISLFEL